MTPKPLARFWKTLDEIPEATTDRRDWSLRLKEDWPAAESYLTPLGVRAKEIACPSPGGDGCPRKVNILKVIEPLFLDDLRAEFARLKARRDTGRTTALRTFQGKLAALRFFDPACGCGNFLIIAYRELRTLETEVIKELNPKGQREFDVTALSKVDVGQFYGIEIGEFFVFDFAAREGDFLRDVGEWVRTGRVKYREDIVDGLENAPASFLGMLQGKNFGKMLVRVAT